MADVLVDGGADLGEQGGSISGSSPLDNNDAFWQLATAGSCAWPSTCAGAGPT